MDVIKAPNLTGEWLNNSCKFKEYVMAKHGEGHLYKLRGKGCWRVRWMFEGKLHDETTGTEDIYKARKIAAQKTACTSALGDVRALTARLEKAKDEQAILEAKLNPSLTLFNMIDAFKSLDVVRRKKNSPSTWRGWNAFGNLLIRKFGGSTEMRQITKEQADDLMREYEKNVSPVQFNTALAFYKRCWLLLKTYDSPTELKARLHEISPWQHILPIKTGEVVGKRPFTKDQLTRIWRVLDEIGNPELLLLFDLARNTGARLNDLVSWQWGKHLKFNTRVDGDKMSVEAVLEWKPIKTKNTTGKLMIIPILDKRVVENLYSRWKKRKSDDEHILESMYALYHKDNRTSITHLCQCVLKKAGIETIVKVEGNSRGNCVYGMHSFRHTLVSELFEKGVDLGTIQHLYTGHGSSYVTELYAHADLDKKRIDLSKLAPIDVDKKKPDGATTFLSMLNDEDKVEYDKIKLMDIDPHMKNALVGLLRFKNKDDLRIIQNWLDRRMSSIK